MRGGKGKKRSGTTDEIQRATAHRHKRLKQVDFSDPPDAIEPESSKATNTGSSNSKSKSTYNKAKQMKSVSRTPELSDSSSVMAQTPPTPRRYKKLNIGAQIAKMMVKNGSKAKPCLGMMWELWKMTPVDEGDEDDCKIFLSTVEALAGKLVPLHLKQLLT